MSILPTDEALDAFFATLKAHKIPRMKLVDATGIILPRLLALEHHRGKPASETERTRIAEAMPNLLLAVRTAHANK